MEPQPPRGYQREDWIYDWKQPTRSLLHSWSALVIVAVVFAALFVAIRVRLEEPVERAVPAAVRMQVGDGELGHSLTQRAMAEGPFPSRFEPGDWEGFGGLRETLRKSTDAELTPHQPRLLPFPEPPATPPLLARRGEPVLPQRPLEVKGPAMPGDWRPVPVLSVLDGMAPTELPTALPPWEGEPPADLTVARWRCLLELDARGRVLQCIPLNGGAAPQLTSWMRGLVFRPAAPEQERRWVAVAVSFEHRAMTHGAESE